MSFTLRTIKTLAMNSAVYARGEAYYNNHAIISYEYKDIEYGEWSVDAKVAGDRGKTYEVSLYFAKDTLDYMDCNCKAFESYGEACTHVVCTLLRYYHEQVKEKVVGEDEYAQRLIELYVTQNKRKLISTGPKVSLYPTLHISSGIPPSIDMSLRVGIERKYVIKDIYEFVQNVERGREISYGKYLSFVHNIDSFDGPSQKLISFLVKHMRKGYYGYLNRYKEPYHGLGSNRVLSLTEDNFPEFFDIMENRTIEFERVYSSEQEDLLLTKEDPPIQFKLSKEEDRFALEIIPKRYIAFDMYEESYVLVNNVLYHCSPAFTKEKYPLLTVMKDKIRAEEQSKVFFVEKEMQGFCSTVLPQIEDELINELEEEAQVELEQYIPKPLKIKLYLDSEGAEIIAKVDFCYGDMIIKPEQDEAFPVHNDGIMRDVTRESNFIQELVANGFYREGDKWRLSREEELYLFLTEGINSLFDLCEVNVTEALKSFKIIKTPIANMGIKTQNNLLTVSFESQEMSIEEVMSVLGAYKEKKKYYRLKDGSFVNIDKAGVEELSHIVDGLDLTEAEKDAGEASLPKYRALYLDNVAKSNKQIKVDRDSGFKKIVRDIKNVEDADYKVPSSLSKILRNYQKTGYRWLKTMSSYEFGGILADDMGLGKTLQIIALICSEHKKEEGAQSIVVCPTSVVLNWNNEFEKFAPHIKVVPIQGTAGQRKALIEGAGEADVLLTSYELLRRDIEAYQDHRFAYIVADEAQYIKNHNTQNSRALKQLQGDHRFALTGTPIENSLAELWSIFDFVMPGYLFGYSKFKKQFESPIVRNKDAKIADRLQKFVAPFIMRRLKKDVLKELPEKIETVIYCEMPTEQKKIYNAYLAKAKRDFTKEVQANGFGKSHIKMLALLTRLRQICCHPGLFLEDYTGQSGKLDLCMELIEDSIKGGHRILLFSQFTTMLDIISEELGKRDIKHLMLTGRTKSDKRMALVDEFNEGEIPIFLISLKAGGTGLNLTAADIVIHYDPWWNLSAQNQATDRAYRIGQMSKVQVFQLIAKDSIEEKIQKLQEKKRDLTESVIKEGETFISKMSEEEVLGLFERI